MIDPDLLIPDKNKSIIDGGIVTLGDDVDSMTFKTLESVCKHYKIDLSKPIKKLKKEELDIVLYGNNEKIKINLLTRSGNTINNNTNFEGIINNLERRYLETTSEWIRDWIEKFMIELPCPTLYGSKIKR